MAGTAGAFFLPDMTTKAVNFLGSEHNKSSFVGLEVGAKKVQKSATQHSAMQEPIQLNVGGIKYKIDRNLLAERSGPFPALFGKGSIAQPDENGEFCIDRDGNFFQSILDYYRTGKLAIPAEYPVEKAQEEFKFYGIELESAAPAKETEPQVQAKLGEEKEDKSAEDSEENYVSDEFALEESDNESESSIEELETLPLVGNRSCVRACSDRSLSVC